jgi:hypothetical protein
MLGFGPIGTLAVATGPSSAAVNYTLIANAGSYAITGVAVTFSDKLAANAGAYAITGVATTFADSLAAASGSYALTGVAASFAETLVPAPGSYTITGVAAPLGAGIAVAPGSYALTGVATIFAETFVPVSGSYALAGVAAAFTITMPAAPGSYALTGVAAIDLLNPIIFNRIGDGGSYVNSEDEWNEYGRRRDELRKAIRRARRRADGDFDTPVPVRREQAAKLPAPSFYIPRVDLSLAGIQSIEQAITTDLNSLASAVAQTKQVAAAKAQAGARAAEEEQAASAAQRRAEDAQVASAAQRLEDEDAIVALLQAA